MPKFLVVITDEAGAVEYEIEEKSYKPRNSKVVLTALETWKRHGLDVRADGDGYLDVKVTRARD